MTTQIESILLKLREMLMRGDFEAGEHLQEIPLAQKLEVSRTPVRLALGALAQEGLLIYRPQRGFQVREFSVKEITDAVLIRGELESVACRMVAERGLSADTSAQLEQTLARAAALIVDGQIDLANYASWFELNHVFHDTIVQEADNSSLSSVIAQLSRVPLAGAGVMAASTQNAERISAVVSRSQVEHEAIFKALRARQSRRASTLMYEHVYDSAESIRRYLEVLRSNREQIPLLKLIAE